MSLPRILTPAETRRARVAAADELYFALEEVVAWHGRRDNLGDDSLLPPDKQEGEIARAMHALAKARGDV